MQFFLKGQTKSIVVLCVYVCNVYCSFVMGDWTGFASSVMDNWFFMQVFFSWYGSGIAITFLGKWPFHSLLSKWQHIILYSVIYL
jgi:hypothetical protein